MSALGGPSTSRNKDEDETFGMHVVRAKLDSRAQEMEQHLTTTRMVLQTQNRPRVKRSRARTKMGK